MGKRGTLAAREGATPQAFIARGNSMCAELKEKLDRLASDSMEPEERKRLMDDVRGQIDRVKKERDRMIGYLAAETADIDEIETRFREIERVNKKKFHIVPPAPANAQIDYMEKKARHFARGLSVCKIFWVFFLGSVLGVYIERIWCMVRYGFYEPRVASIYGPFNPVYGIGAAVLTVALYRFRNRSPMLSFVFGAIVGSAVEYMCSWVQEIVFGSASWDYSMKPFNLNGRICLLYSVYWGVLGVLWIKELYPRMAALVLKIPNRIGRPLSAVLAVVLAADLLLTGAIVIRWMNRVKGEPPRTAVGEFFDEHYPDERLEKRFSNLEFVSDAPE